MVIASSLQPELVERIRVVDPENALAELEGVLGFPLMLAPGGIS